MSEQLESWKEEKQEVSISELKAKVALMVEARADYSLKDKIAKEAYAKRKSIEAEVISMLKASDMKKFSAPGFGTVRIESKQTVRVADGLDNKQLLADWIRETFGEDGYYTYLSVNSQTLNRLYKEQYEESQDKATFSIPGLGQAVEQTTLKFSTKE